MSKRVNLSLKKHEDTPIQALYSLLILLDEVANIDSPITSMEDDKEYVERILKR